MSTSFNVAISDMSPALKAAILAKQQVVDNPQPDHNGEFATPADGAVFMAAHGKRQTPLNGKAAFLPNWNESATTDPAQIRAWAAQYPSCNFGSVADDGVIFEADSPEVRKRFSGTFSNTLTVASSEGRGHRYYLPAAVEHVAQNATTHGDFSLRKHNAYCVSPGSIHPVTGKQYRVAINVPMTTPTAQEIAFWKSEREEKKATTTIDEPIPSGKRNSTITSILGKAREGTGADYEVLFALARQHNERCQPPLPDHELQTIAQSIAKYEYKPAGPVIMGGRNLSEQAAITPAPVAPTEWRKQFRNLSEMEQGDIVMIIDGVLQEGTCFLGADPGHGKTLVALAFSKAVTLGEPLFGIPEYTVKQPRNVIYLIPESGDRAFRHRGESFRLPPDDRFIARTISSGGPLALSDPALMEAVRQTKPVVILDTASRFLQANDENSAAQNRLLVNDITALRAAGAVCVIILHHAKKATNEKREAMTLQNMLRGTTDFGAMCDQAYGIRMDEHLYSRGAGPMEIELVNLKDRERLGGLTSIRLAASYKKPGNVFPTSYIDETGNFRPVDYKESKARDEVTLNVLVEANPMMTITELCDATGIKAYTVKETLKRFGWHMAKGGPNGHSPWHKESVSGQCPYKPGKKGDKGDQSDQEIILDAPVAVN